MTLTDENLISKGKHGNVYRVKNIKDGKFYAIKVFNDLIDNEKQFIMNCNRIVKELQKIDSPFFPKYIEEFLHKG
jgi:serine/threonine protein kinase